MIMTTIFDSTMMKTQTDLHLELDLRWTNLHTLAFTQLQYSVVNNSATDKLFVAVILGIYINYTSHFQLIGH